MCVLLSNSSTSTRLLGSVKMNLCWYFLIFFFVHDVYTHPNASENSTELIAVAVTFRHGDRSPFVSFPNDKYFNETYWPNGLGGEMTENGIKRMYGLGQWLRQRYNNFISETYSSKELYAYSPDFNRCLMSVTATLAGLYPPKGRQIWNSELLWQPIPVHSQHVLSDEILTHTRHCPKYDKMLKEVDKIKNEVFERKYKDFLDLIGTKTGLEKVIFDDIRKIRSVFYCYKNYNVTFLPDWLQEDDQNLMDYLAGVRYAIPTSTRELTRLRVGTFYDYIFNYFNKFVKSSTKNQSYNFLMISAPDVAIASILDGMGCYKNRPVGFADTVIWELKKIDEKYVLNLMYKLEDKLEQLDCCQNCVYEIFQKNLTDVTLDVDQWKKECLAI